MASLRHATRWLRDLGWKDRLEYAALAAIAVAAVVHARSYLGASIDDAFITYRHSWNLIHGGGLSYNPHERIEGTSSALFAVLMAVPIALGADPYHIAGWLGAAALVGCCLAAYCGVRACVHDPSRRLLALGAAAIVAASSSLAFHSQTGLETLLYASLVAAAFSLQLSSDGPERPWPAWALVFGVAAAARPEGFAFFFLVFAIACLWRGRRAGAWRAAQRELVAFAVVFGPWLLLRLAYFGTFLPNSVIAKGGHLGWAAHASANEVLDRLVQGPGGALLIGYIQSHWLASLLVLGTLLLQQTRRAGVIAAAIALGCAGLAVWSEGDWMPYDRLLTASITPLAVAAALGLRGLFFHSEQRTRLGHLPSAALALCALALIVSRARTRLDMESVRWVNLERLREMGKRLAPVTRSDDLLATEIAGILPYYWGARTLDMLGLCDPHIARTGTPAPSGSGREDTAYVVAQRPTFYAFNVASEGAAFYAKPAFAGHRDEYELLQLPYRFLAPVKASPLFIFVRKDRRGVEELARALGARLVDLGTELKRLGYVR